MADWWHAIHIQLRHYIVYYHHCTSFFVDRKYDACFSRKRVSRCKSIHFIHETKGEKEKESDDLLKNLACSYVSWKEGRRSETERRRETGGWKKPFRPKPGKSEQEEERRELWGYFIVKMKAPPLVAAPLVRGRRNRPIDSRIYRKGSMIQPGLPTTTLATADDSWCSWPESLLRIRRSSFRRLIALLLVWRDAPGFREPIHWNCLSIVKTSSTVTDYYFNSVNLILQYYYYWK